MGCSRMSIRGFLKKVLSPENKRKVQSVILNLDRLIHGRRRIRSSYKWQTLGDTSNHCFFGYYDVSPFNNKGEILFLQLDKEEKEAEVMLYDRNNRQYKQLANNYAWNWQQGSRLRWFPKSDDRIILNDFKEGKFIAREINIRSSEERTYCKPLYDIDCNGRYGLSLDFVRLGVKRPGYGYSCLPYTEPADLSGEGIDLVDLNANTAKRIITYNDISAALRNDTTDYKNKYINHLYFSPSGDKFMFFWLTIVGSYHKAYMLVYDLKTEKILPLETGGKVSHYLWLDEEHLLCTVYDERQECRYIIYGIDGSKKHVFKSIDYDGHPIWYRNGLILTDSYPDRKGFQHLMVCNLETDETKQILEIFQEPAISVERRTDLHPRYDQESDTICIDASPRGKRDFLLITQK